jgi:uncharacterized protein (TIGR02996 family)
MSRPPRLEVVAFLNDVKDNPDDPAPRLILADWLAENGDEADQGMAEYIRVQWAARGRKMYASDWEEGERRRSLFRRYKDEWFGPLLQTAFEMKCGLLALPLTKQPWLRLDRLRAAQLEAWCWVESLELSEAVWALGQVAMSPLLTGIRALRLSFVPVGDKGACALAEAPLLRGLRELEMDWAGIRDKGALALAASPYLGRLKRLALTGNPIGQKARRALQDRFGAALVLPP